MFSDVHWLCHQDTTAKTLSIELTTDGILSYVGHNALANEILSVPDSGKCNLVLI